MAAVLSSLVLGFGQLADPRMLRILAKSLAVSLIAFAVLGTGGWYALDAGLQWLGLGDALVAGGDAVRGAAAAVLTVVALWLTWRIVAMAVIQFSLAEQARAGLGSALRALIVNLIALPFALALLFAGIGTALLFLVVNAFLIGRELQDMVWLRHRRDIADTAPISGARRFLLGASIAALLMVPFANLIAPVLGAASAAHLVHRKARRP